jgi:hypothetical protein
LAVVAVSAALVEEVPVAEARAEAGKPQIRVEIADLSAGNQQRHRRKFR